MSAGRRLTSAGVVAAAVLLAGAGTAFADGRKPAATPEERAAALARPAVVYLEQHWSGYVIDEDNKFFNGGKAYDLTMRCTGFGVDPSGYIATAGHCVDPGMEGVGREFLQTAVDEAIQNNVYTTTDPVRLLSFAEENWKIEGKAKGSAPDRQVFVQRGVVAGGKTTGEAKPARVVDFRPLSQGDVALLKVDATDWPTVELAADSDVEVGTPVLSIGYPGSTDEVTDQSFEPTNKDGQINSKKTSGSVPVYEMSAALSGGMSGGPTVNMDGRVVGVNSFKITGEEQAFNFLAPSSNLSELLSRNGVKPALGTIDKTFRKGLADYYAGHYTRSIGEFDKVLSLSPTHEQAQDYKTKAANAREKYGDVAEANGAGALVVIGLVVLAGLLMVVLVGVLILVLVLRGRRRRTQSAGSGMGQQNAASMGYNQAGWDQRSTSPPPTAPPYLAPGGPHGTAAPPPPPGAPHVTWAPPAHVTSAPPAQQPVSGPPEGPIAAGSVATAPSTAPASGASLVCGNCGTQSPPGSLFCPRCGHGLG